MSLRESVLRRALHSALTLVMFALLLAGLVQLAGAASIQAKASLAPLLIERAWQRTLANGQVGAKPWPWADTHPVGQLEFPGMGKTLTVLASDRGNALAFGPGHAQDSAPLGRPGVAVIGGHRDTHFQFLREVTPGAEIYLALPNGERQRYRITHRRVIDTQDPLGLAEVDHAALLLVTCFPFDTLQAGGSLRYIVTALPIT